MQLGCGAHVLGKPGLHSYDGRRGQHAPHLSVSLVYLRAVLHYLVECEIRMYRMAADLVPYATHPAYPQLHHQLDECCNELAELGQWVMQQHIRLSFHAPASVALATIIPAGVEQARLRLNVLTGVLDRMALGPEAVVVVHVGGLAGGADAAIERWLRAWESLPVATQARLALEHDEHGASLAVVLRIHAATGVPIVFDHLHWLLHNPEGYNLAQALEAALATWPPNVRPKAHFATPRTELRAVLKPEGATRRRRWLLAPPRPGHHSDFVHPWEFARFVEVAGHCREFDVLVEAKASDVAVVRLRDDLARYVPEVAQWLYERARQ